MGPNYGDLESAISSLPQSPGISPPQRPSFVPKIAMERVHNVVAAKNDGQPSVQQVQTYTTTAPGGVYAMHPQASVPQAQQPLTVLSNLNILTRIFKVQTS